MGRRRYPRTLPELLLVTVALVAGVAFLLSLLFAILGAGAVFVIVGCALAVAAIWDLAVERPRRQDRLALSFATADVPAENVSLGARDKATHWSDLVPGPLGALARSAPATLATFLIVVAALFINDLFGAIGSDDTDDAIYVVMQPGAVGDFAKDGQASPSLRVTLVRVLDRAAEEDPSLTPNPWRKYWAANVIVENTGSEDISAPAWKLRACDHEYSQLSASGVGEDLPAGFTLSPGQRRTGWVVFEIRRFAEPEWLRARLQGHPDLHFAARATCLERR